MIPERKINLKVAIVLAVSILILFIASSITNVISLTFVQIVSITEKEGVFIEKVLKPSPAENVLREGEIIAKINEKNIATIKDFNEIVGMLHPSDAITLQTNVSTYFLTLAENPRDRNKPYIGIYVRQNFERIKLPVHKEIVYMAPRLIFSYAWHALYLTAILYYGFRTALTAFLFGVAFALVPSIYYSIQSKLGLIQVVTVVPAIKNAPIFVFVLLLLIFLIFVLPALWIKRNDDKFLRKSITIVSLLITLKILISAIGDIFSVRDILYSLTELGFFVAWLRCFNRIFLKFNFDVKQKNK